MSDLVGNPEYRFSHNEAQIYFNSIPDYSCGTKEIFSANSLGTEASVLSDCDVSCDLDDDCWMVLFTPPYNCVKLAYNTEVIAAGVVEDNSPVTISGKFCIEGNLAQYSIRRLPSTAQNTEIIIRK